MLVFIGGGAGSVLRYLISVFISRFSFSYPLSTFLSNMISVIILSVLLWFSVKQNQPWLYALLIIGFCGGLSTFSSLSFETFELLRSGKAFLAISNIFIQFSISIAVLYFFAKKLV